MERYLTHPPKRQRVAEVQNVHAVVYTWTLDRIANEEHVLYGIKYVGQVVRASPSADESLRMRTQEHVNDATRNPKDIGLHATIRTFGRDAFTVHVVDTAFLPRDEAMEWANAREIALIAEHGGILRDPDRRCRQTLNLTKGGQGNPRAVWESIKARSERAWKCLRTHLQAYYETHNNLRVPQSYRAANGDALGKVVSSIRSHRCYVDGHPERVAWLRERGFRMHAKNAAIDARRWIDLEVRAHVRLALEALVAQVEEVHA